MKIIIAAGRAWQADNAFKHSAAVSFYTLFSLAPVSVVAITLMTWVFGEPVAKRQFSTQITELVGPASAQTINAAADAAVNAEHDGKLSAISSVVLLLVGATTVFTQLQESLNDIWGVRARREKSGLMKLLLRRLVSFAMVLTIGFLLLVSLILTTAMTALLGSIPGRVGASPWVLAPLDLAVSLGVITCLFALIFKVLPDVHLRWREVWLGGFVTALLFGSGKYLIALYLGHSTVASVYGAAASLVALLVWVYYSCAIFFYGAEFTKAHHGTTHRAIEPKTHVDRHRKITAPS